MKKLKYLLFILPFCFYLNVFAQDYNVTSSITSPTSGSSNAFSATEILNSGTGNITYNFNTRYQGQLSRIRFNIPIPNNWVDGSCFSTGDLTYTLTLNMATNDWRNHFSRPFVSNSSSGTNWATSNVTFVSRKQIKFTFKIPNTSSCYDFLYVNLVSTDEQDVAFTGETNFNLSSVILSTSTGSSSGGSSSSGSGSSSSSGSTITCSNGLVISSSSYRYSDVDISSKYLDSSGQQVSHNSFGIVSYIPISPHSTYYLTRNISTSSTTNYCLYTSSKTLISCSQYGSSTFYTINTGNASYISLSVRDDYILTLGTCRSPLDNANQNTQDIIDNQNQNTQDIIENNNDNTQQIIENNNNNTQNIIDGINSGASAINDKINKQIDNANQNTQKEIDSQRVCKLVDVSFSNVLNNALGSTGHYVSSVYYNVTDYINIKNSTVKKLDTYNGSAYFCYYDFTKTLISCSINSSVPINTYLDIPSNAEYVRFTIDKSANKPRYEVCKNGNQVINDSLNELNDNITNSNVDSNTGTGFFDNFTNEDFGLSEIITIPLNTIQSLTSKTCIPLQIPIPFTNSNVSLPCMTEIYENKFPSIYNLWKIVSFGIVAYLIAIDIFHIVKGFKDPESDKVEVLDL